MRCRTSIRRCGAASRRSGCTSSPRRCGGSTSRRSRAQVCAWVTCQRQRARPSPGWVRRSHWMRCVGGTSTDCHGSRPPLHPCVVWCYEPRLKPWTSAEPLHPPQPLHRLQHLLWLQRHQGALHGGVPGGRPHALPARRAAAGVRDVLRHHRRPRGAPHPHPVGLRSPVRLARGRHLLRPRPRPCSRGAGPCHPSATSASRRASSTSPAAPSASRASTSSPPARRPSPPSPASTSSACPSPAPRACSSRSCSPTTRCAATFAHPAAVAMLMVSLSALSRRCAVSIVQGRAAYRVATAGHHRRGCHQHRARGPALGRGLRAAVAARLLPGLRPRRERRDHHPSPPRPSRRACLPPVAQRLTHTHDQPSSPAPASSPTPPSRRATRRGGSSSSTSRRARGRRAFRGTTARPTR